MLRRRNIVAAVAVLPVVMFVVREIRNARNKTAAFSVVRDLGGRIGSVPFEPIGTEYRISFHNREFSAEELDRLTVLNRLTGRNTVGVSFVESNVTPEQITSLRRRMPDVTVVRVVSGKTLAR